MSASALTAAQLAAHAQMYQTVSAQAAAIHEMLVDTLVASSSYAGHRGGFHRRLNGLARTR